VKNVKPFLEYARFYGRFIVDPLSSLPVKDVPINFSKECLEAFTKLKETLTTAPILHPPIYGELFGLMYDASNYVIGLF